MNNKEKLIEASKKLGKPFVHEIKVSRIKGPSSRLLEIIEQQKREALRIAKINIGRS